MAATRLQTLADLERPANRHKKKILIDVYPNPTAAYCDQVITIKAGTDGALALSMMHVLKNEHLVDKSFVEKVYQWISGICRDTGCLYPGMG